ncbi:MAG: hypothetical protein RLZZ32_2303, partial [Cyanobacteriota bacterium]
QGSKGLRGQAHHIESHHRAGRITEWGASAQFAGRLTRRISELKLA